MGQIKVNRENCARHLVEKELELAGKTIMDTLDDMEWYLNFTITREQYKEFEKYSIGLIKKTFKVNTAKAESIFSWFYITFGLRIKN